ncbi:MAG TPA: hypothetical protein VGA94_06090 [Thermodesulfobacteriota bacterium]
MRSVFKIKNDPARQCDQSKVDQHLTKKMKCPANKLGFERAHKLWDGLNLLPGLAPEHGE